MPHVREKDRRPDEPSDDADAVAARDPENQPEPRPETDDASGGTDAEGSPASG